MYQFSVAELFAAANLIPLGDRLTFTAGNAKLAKEVWHMSLPAGYTCPGAKDCWAKAVFLGMEGTKEKWGIKDGPATVFRCYAASDEARWKGPRKARHEALEIIKRYARKGKGGNRAATLRVAALIVASLPPVSRLTTYQVGGRSYSQIIRPHIGGDYFSQVYFDAWLAVAKAFPDILVYGYTKSLRFWVARLDSMPDNFILTASWGGKYDNLISKHGLRSVRVVHSEAEAARLGLEIDHDDSHAMIPGGDFALLIHGTQPKGSAAGKASAIAARAGKGYGKKGKETRRYALPLA